MSHPKPLCLYDFQEEAVRGLRANIREGVKNQVLCAPTGSGKTIIAAYLLGECAEKGKRAMILVDRITLIDQTSTVLDEYGIRHGVIQADHWRWRPHELIQVASPQTLERRPWPGPLDLILVDECHTSRNVINRRIEKRDCVTVGLTATPFTRGMGEYYDAVVSSTTTQELIESGRLVQFEVFAASEPDMGGARTAAGEWTVRDASARAIPIVGDCVREYLRRADGKKFLVFAADIAHCEEIQRQFLAAGIQVARYTSRTPDEECREILKEFRSPDSYIRGLVSVAKLAKGFDVPDIECIIMARPLRSSLAEHIQILGRGLRSSPGKRRCVILDHSGNMVRFWEEMQEFFTNGPKALDNGTARNKKTATTPARGPRKCPKCSYVHNPRPFCPQCGNEYPRPSRVHEDGDLVKLGEGAVAPWEVKQEAYSQLLHIAQERGYKRGWAAHKFQERFGIWPRGLVETTSPPSPDMLRWVFSRQIAFSKARAKASA